jgi:cytochrome b
VKQLIWDLPIRIFHWLLFGALIGAFSLAEFSEKETANFYFHVVFGVLAGLLIFWRIIWGFVGSKHARWSELFVTPSSFIGYFKEVLSGRGSYHPGHNPGSAIVILAILFFIAATVLTGLLSNKVELFEEMHENLPVVLLVLVGLHVAGVLIATMMNKENYLLGMITGYRRALPAEGIKSSHTVMAGVMLILVLGPWIYFIMGFDRNSGLFKAPGTQWSLQIGEPEADGGKPNSEPNSVED